MDTITQQQFIWVGISTYYIKYSPDANSSLKPLEYKTIHTQFQSQKRKYVILDFS